MHLFFSFLLSATDIFIEHEQHRADLIFSVLFQRQPDDEWWASDSIYARVDVLFSLKKYDHAWENKKKLWSFSSEIAQRVVKFSQKNLNFFDDLKILKIFFELKAIKH